MAKKWMRTGADFVAERRKAIAALVAPVAAFLTANGILDVDPVLASLIAALVSGVATYAVPNKPQEG